MWSFKELLVYLEYNRENKNETNTNSRKHIQINRNKDVDKEHWQYHQSHLKLNHSSTNLLTFNFWLVYIQAFSNAVKFLIVWFYLNSNKLRDQIKGENEHNDSSVEKKKKKKREKEFPKISNLA